MEALTYAIEAEAEARHWWFLGRRRLFGRLISTFGLPHDAPILDIGTSTGTNLRLLKEMGFGVVTGVDKHEASIRYCNEKGLGAVQQGDICNLHFGDGTFALVLATDIIEHVDDDLRALREVARVLKPGGRVLITVPAFQSLWGLQDDIGHHRRRYRKAQLLERINAAGLGVERAFYFNFILFFPIWLVRQLLRIHRFQVLSENEINSPLLNRILTAVFTFDVRVASILKPPFGVSVLAVAAKPLHRIA